MELDSNCHVSAMACWVAQTFLKRLNLLCLFASSRFLNYFYWEFVSE